MSGWLQVYVVIRRRVHKVAINGIHKSSIPKRNLFDAMFAMSLI